LRLPLPLFAIAFWIVGNPFDAASRDLNSVDMSANGAPRIWMFDRYLDNTANFIRIEIDRRSAPPAGLLLTNKGCCHATEVTGEHGKNIGCAEAGKRSLSSRGNNKWIESNRNSIMAVRFNHRKNGIPVRDGIVIESQREDPAQEVVSTNYGAESLDATLSNLGEPLTSRLGPSIDNPVHRSEGHAGRTGKDFVGDALRGSRRDPLFITAGPISREYKATIGCGKLAITIIDSRWEIAEAIDDGSTVRGKDSLPEALTEDHDSPGINLGVCRLWNDAHPQQQYKVTVFQSREMAFVSANRLLDATEITIGNSIVLLHPIKKRHRHQSILPLSIFLDQ
jgi:hypothetical protein